jgi:hypothetical protein
MATVPTVADLQALIVQLQDQVTALEHAAAAAAPAAPAATTAATTAVVFADTPQTLGAKDLIDYSSKRGSDIYKQGIAPLDDKALTEGFNMTTNQTVVFTEAMLNRATAMGWNKGSKQITTFTNSSGVSVDIIKSYGQIDEATLKTACERFCKAGQVDAESRAKQNNTMMSMCLNKSLTANEKASLLTYRNEYTFDGVEYAPLMYKIIMRLATIDSVATTQTLRDNLQNLGVFAVTVKGDIDKINAEFDMNYSQLLARGATLDDPIGILFDAYLLVPCYNFTKYISTKHDEYLDGNLTSLTHEAMMSMAKRKFDFLKTKGKWGAKSPDDEKIVAMAAEINSLKGKLKLDPKLSAIAGEGKKDDGSKKKKNRMNTSNKRERKKDEAWKKEPPKAGESKTGKQVGKYTFNWCEHHMAWTVHKPADCNLGKRRKDEQKKPKANSATIAAAATSTVNPHFAALLAAMGNLDQNE